MLNAYSNDYSITLIHTSLNFFVELQTLAVPKGFSRDTLGAFDCIRHTELNSVCSRSSEGNKCK